MTRIGLFVLATVLGARSGDADPAPKPRGPAIAPPCDAAKLQQRGEEQWAIGDAVGALTTYERAIKCKPSEQLYVRATMAACKLANRGVYPDGPGQDRFFVRRAKTYIDQLPVAKRSQMYRLCAPPCTLH